MQGDPLSQLRDIHLPVEPSWWPPAPGWWLLALLITIALVWTTGRVAAWHRGRAPYRAARLLEQQAYQRYLHGAMSAHEYAHESNAILKRLLVHVRHTPGAAAASGDEWDAFLQNLFAEHAVAAGDPVRATLRSDRFRAQAQIDAAALHQAMQQALGRSNR
jgi:hypothetical protein